MGKALRRAGAGIGTLAATLLMSGAAFAEVIGRAVPDEMGLQPVVTPIGREIHFFHNDILLPIITVIVLFVLALLVIVMVRFNERANPTPSRTTHHTLLEVAWTVIPVMILVVIAIPSFRLLTNQLVLPKADVTVKVTGHQWYWSYEYPKDEGGFGFDSFIKADKDLKPGEPRLLSVDNEAVVPVNKVVKVQVTGADVIHSFVVQAFGIRIDAVPGRLNETWFKADRVGTYYGQCSKICGKDHAFMPIVIRVVSDKDYEAWLQQAKKKFASIDAPFTVAGLSPAAR
jgi:cytochrome c oxidase subunit II